MAQERAEEVGATIGYHIKLEKKASPNRTRCLLMTTGVLLRKIQLEGFIGVSHLFIDEGEKPSEETACRYATANYYMHCVLVLISVLVYVFLLYYISDSS